MNAAQAKGSKCHGGLSLDRPWDEQAEAVSLREGL